MLRALTSLLEDLLLTQSGQSALMRNIDLQQELAAIAAAVSFEWIENTARAIQQVRSGMRRNLLRSLALDAFAAEIHAGA
jgi:DNA polymerase-3 subunit delta'